MKLVKCINNDYRENLLTIYKIYEVLHETGVHYVVKCDIGNKVEFIKDIFEEVQIEQPKEEINKGEQTKMKLVKCINNKNRESILTIDKVYSVLYENDLQYEIISDDKLATLFYKIRFTELDTEQPTEPIKLDELIKPSYYNKENGISPFEYIKANNLNFFEGNIIKYVTRYKEKNGLEDLIKAKTYLDELIKQNK